MALKKAAIFLLSVMVLCLVSCGNVKTGQSGSGVSNSEFQQVGSDVSNSELQQSDSDMANSEFQQTGENAADSGNGQTNADATNSEIEENRPSSDTEVISKPEILRFIDAWGGWHETQILPSVAKHNYKWECLSNDGQEVSYIGDENYTIRKGIDVSYHQGIIDWEKVKADGYDFAFIRIGYRGYGKSGKLVQDSEFHRNIQNAQAAGIDVGVYFFAQAINEEEAMEEAEFVLNILKDYELQLPVVYDPELIRDDEARTDDVTGEQFTKNTIVFCEAMKAAGFEPMIYSNMIWEAELFNMEQLQVYPFWYADYEKIPQTPYAFTFWQYSESGTVDGVNGKVDLDIWFCPTE